LNVKSLRSFGVLSVVLATTLGALAGCQTMTYRPAAPGATGAVAAQGWDKLTFETATDRKPVTLTGTTPVALTKMVEAGMDVWSVNVKGRKATGVMNQAHADLARSLGLGVQELPSSVTRMRADSGYRTNEQIFARMRALAAKGSAFGVELVDIGDSWEKTQGKGGSDILALHFTKGKGKPVVTFAGCHHAREIVTPEMVLKMAEHLVDGYGTDAEVTAAIDTRDIWIVPVVNPDGHALAVKGQDQRKNTNTQTGGKRRIGVDLNRNYATAWGKVGDSGQPESDVFRGTEAFSEPETKAMRDLHTKNPPAVFLSFHSYSNAVMWAWDNQHAPPADAAKLSALGKKLGQLSGYDAYQGAEMYLNGGDDIDWTYDKFKTFAYTIEVGNSGFMPPSSQLPKYWNENKPMMLYSLKVADNPSAVSGPETVAKVNRDGLSVSAPGATKAEYFIGKPGKAGTGTALSLNGKATFTEAGAARQVVYIHSQDAKGTWGPWETVWSK
jgi:hypothetical protein